MPSNNEFENVWNALIVILSSSLIPKNFIISLPCLVI